MRRKGENLCAACVSAICDDIAVIYRGKLVESGPVEDIFDRPKNDYTRLLIDAMPDPDPDRSPFRKVVSA